MNVENKTNKKIILSLLLILIIGLFILVIYYLFFNIKGKIIIELNSNPKDVSILINKETFSFNNQNYFEKKFDPGTYNIVIRKKYYKDYGKNYSS